MECRIAPDLPKSGMSRTLFGTACRRLLGGNRAGRSALPVPLGSRPWAPASRLAFRSTQAAAPSTEASPAADAIVDADGANGAFKSTAYPFTEIETKWQAHWDEHQTFRTPDFKDLDTSKPKFYALDMFPYPRYAS